MAIQEHVGGSWARAVDFGDAEERLLAGLRLSELDSALSALAGTPILKATIASAAETLIDALKGYEIKIGAFQGELGEIELVVVARAATKTLELAFGEDYVRPTYITSSEATELPKARRPYGIRSYARWLTVG